MSQLDTYLPAVWIRSAVLGSLWASSEIILGSFLHNLHVPMRSMILAAIGVMIMTAIGKEWKIMGVFWRAGLICALMKTVSPSGVILAPMLAIFAQGVLMEAAVRIGGFRVFSFLIGGILALTWNLFQFLAYQLFLYGFDILEIYKNIYYAASDIFPLLQDQYMIPFYFLLVLHLVFGLAGAGVGLVARTGSRPEEINAKMPSKHVQAFMNNAKKNRRKSVPLLFTNTLCFIAFFIIASFLDQPWNIIMAIPLLVFWLVLYRSSLKIFRKPAFWIAFFLITFISAILIDYGRNQAAGFTLNGLWVGLSINFRALVLVTGLNVIGYELSNEKIRDRIRTKGMRNLFMAMEAASSILPEMMKSLPTPRVFFRHPRNVLAYQLSMINQWLFELASRYESHEHVILLTGGIHAGKTSFLKNCLPRFAEEKWSLAGFICPSVFLQDERLGYDICDVNHHACIPLGRKNLESDLQIGHYYIQPKGLKYGLSILQPENLEKAQLILIDEIGPWELTGHGWAVALPEILHMKGKLHIWVVRQQIIDAVIEKWRLKKPTIIHIGHDGSEKLIHCVRLKLHEMNGNGQLPEA